MTEKVIEISIQNKMSDREKCIEKYFKNATEKKFTITYLFIVDEATTPTMLDKIFTRSQEALSEISAIHPPSNDSKNEFVISNEMGSLLIKVGSKIIKKESVWEVYVEGEFELLEIYRTEFLLKIKDNCLKSYLIVDEISDEISVAAYPIIRNMENTMREYLIRFFSKKFGSRWWENNTTQTLKSKAAERKKEGFSKLLNMELYNIDFDDLIILLNGQFGQKDSKAILDALDVIVEHREKDTFTDKILLLKERFLGNWEKFFVQEIRIDNFLLDWKAAYDVRCEVAHNSLLSLTRFIKLVDLHSKLEKNIEILINEQRIIKTSEYVILDKINSLDLKLTKYDVESLIKESFLFISSINFGKEVMTSEEFQIQIDLLRESMKLFGEVKISSIQMSDVNEGDSNSVGRPSVNAKFLDIPTDVLGALELGLNNNMFNNKLIAQ
ncbi:hypothetical protein SAMN05720606_101339 [Paenibacillus polysaccharolyticus]|uniref:Apea-like HEPN domain-containing protein n=1 Tax=Paenibacillus polysaccharolyticus TaxID=582692 RepID=A0A1G5BEH5_9BACL|nr:hypothetical protein [Paenibacillus polysaccharolyticus]SCX88519.1 hypothetical protein SAMN05720606_101339 [Paenibacillus polysaccharolyticus]